MTAPRSGTKKRSIRQTLFISILAVFLVFIILFTLLRINAERDSIQQSIDLVENNIYDALTLVDQSHQLLERSLDDRLREDMNLFMDKYKEADGDPSEIDLYALKQTLGKDIDLYIINSEGVVEYTTYEPDQGLDFKQWPDFYDYITQLRETGGFEVDRVATETQTGILRKFAYQPTPDREYILEVGLKTTHFREELAELDITKITDELSDLDPNLESVRLFGRHGMVFGDEEAVVSEDVRERVVDSFNNKVAVEHQESATKLVRYIYVDLENEQYASDLSKVVELTYDLSDYHQNSLITYATSLASILAFVVIINFISAKMVKPIEKIVSGTEKIANGDLGVKINVNSNDELGYLSQNFNEMTESLKSTRDQLQATLNFLPDATFAVDTEGKIILWNKAMEEMTGIKAEDMLGRGEFEHSLPFYGERRPGLADMVLKSHPEFEDSYLLFEKQEDRSVFGEAFCPCIGDAGMYVWVKASPLYDSEGKLFGAIETIRDITERKRTEEKIQHMSYHDRLTGLYNRYYLEEQMNIIDTEQQLPISIIMIDLNGLKLVNDTHGYSTGDEMLKNTAAVLRQLCQDSEIIARLGGDEFVICLPQTSEKEAMAIGREISKAYQQEQIKDLPVSISLGTAVKEDTEKKLVNVLREAEDEMYQNKLTESRSGKSAVLNTLLKTLAEKSFETESHTRNMQDIAFKIGEKLGLPDAELHRLNLLITLHDIGKINIPEELLTKKEALSSAEWEVMKKHPETGSRIAQATEEFDHVAEDILAHHERWDGSGYPQGLKGEAIPLLARITAIADAYEVMSNGRPYKKTMDQEAILAEFKRCAGTHFDPRLVEIFTALIEK